MVTFFNMGTSIWNMCSLNTIIICGDINIAHFNIYIDVSPHLFIIFKTVLDPIL